MREELKEGIRNQRLDEIGRVEDPGRAKDPTQRIADELAKKFSTLRGVLLRGMDHVGQGQWQYQIRVLPPQTAVEFLHELVRHVESTSKSVWTAVASIRAYGDLNSGSFRLVLWLEEPAGDVVS